MEQTKPKLKSVRRSRSGDKSKIGLTLDDDPILRKMFSMKLLESNPESGRVFKHFGYDDNEFEMRIDFCSDIVLKTTKFCMDTAIATMCNQNKHVIVIGNNYTSMIDSFKQCWGKYYSASEASEVSPVSVSDSSDDSSSDDDERPRINLSKYICNVSKTNENSIKFRLHDNNKYIFLCIGNVRCLEKMLRAYKSCRSRCGRFYLVVDKNVSGGPVRSKVIAELKNRSYASSLIMCKYSSLILKMDSSMFLSNISFDYDNNLNIIKYLFEKREFNVHVRKDMLIRGAFRMKQNETIKYLVDKADNDLGFTKLLNKLKKVPVVFKYTITKKILKDKEIPDDVIGYISKFL